MPTIRIDELAPGALDPPPRLVYEYETPGHYALALRRGARGWTARLTYRRFPRPVAKRFESTLFEPFIPEPRVFRARAGGRDAGWIEVGFEPWSNRLRVYELLVAKEMRGRGVGAALLARAEAVARERGARAIVLETQSCNVPAIRFYLAQGFDLAGFDAAAYTNEDAARGEVRLEMARRVPWPGSGVRASPPR